MPDGGNGPAAPAGPRGNRHRPQARRHAGKLRALSHARVRRRRPERERWLQEARRCRRLARTVSDLQTIESLETMATEYEAKARECVFESA